MCVDVLGYVHMYVCESYVTLDECDDPPSCLCSLSVHMVVIFWWFSFLCEFCFLYCDMSMFCPLVDCCLCEWVGGVLLMMCWMCLALLLRVVCVCEWLSPVRFVLSLLYLCAFQMNPVCVVCVWLYLMEVCCLFVTKVTNQND